MKVLGVDLKRSETKKAIGMGAALMFALMILPWTSEAAASAVAGVRDTISKGA